MQLVQLQQAQQRFKDQGIGLAAISYDSQAILKDFAERQHITFPLLADPQSEIIRKYGVLNVEAKGMTQGMALPGFFYVDANGKVREKFFEAAYTDRYTANDVIAKLFPELTEQAARKIEAPHISLTLQQSDQVVVPGSRLTLIAEINLGADLHVYAPGVRGYIPIELKLEPAPDVRLQDVVLPEPKTLFLEAIKERVPVFEGRFRMTEDVTLSADRTFIRSLGQGKTISVKGSLKYQACDHTTCYTPTTVPVGWDFQVVPLDFQRSPEAIQHR
jgi:hypothetical protein